MSKVDELRAKYSKVSAATFKKLSEGDTTKTKKYLEFMLKLWVNKNHQITTATELVKLVNMFDELLPYIENKDIYNRMYEDIPTFLDVINKAMDEKDDKTFVREEHANILFENDEYLLLQPLTHRGSLKYGANTKWCTASKKDLSTFESYTRNGFLAYLLSKKNDKSSDYQKLAFYINSHNDPLFNSVDVYNTLDKHTTTFKICENGWDIHTIFDAISIVRANYSNWVRIESAKNQLKNAVIQLSKIDFNLITNCIKIVEDSSNEEYISDVKNKINEFIKQIPVKL